MSKFLIIRLSSIGDIVLTSPIIRILATQIPDSEVHFFVKRQFVDVIKHNPHISKIHVYDNDIKANLKDFRKEQFDYVIDLHKNLRTLRVRKGLTSLVFTFDKLNFKKWLFVNLKINKLPDLHITDRYFSAIEKFDVTLDNKGLEYFIAPEEEVDIVESYGNAYTNGYIAWVTGAAHYTKQIPLEKTLEVIDKLELPVILLGGGADKQTAKVILSKTKNQHVANAVGKLTINQSASIVKQSQVVVTPDTGLMHIAAAFHKKIVSVWGNTVPEFGMAPYKPDIGSVIFEVKNLRCRPCSKIGHDQCPKRHFNCMNLLSNDKIIFTIKKLFKS